jgi:hypothetical protein
MRFCFAVSSQLNIPASAANLEDINKVLNSKICVDRSDNRGPHPLLLGYQPLIGNFLEGPTVPRSQETPVEPSVLYVAQPSSSIPQFDHPSLIPTGAVLEMAPPVDVFEIIGNKQKGASSSKAKGKAKQGVQTRRSKKAVFEVIAPEQPDLGEESRLAPLTEQSGLPQIVEHVEAKQAEEQAPKPKRARVVIEQTEIPGPSSQGEPWVPEIMVQGQPVTNKHTVFDTSDVEFSARVAHALTRATCLPGDYEVWEEMSSGRLFRHISRGLVMVWFLN